MKYLILVMTLFTISGCASTATTEAVKSCDPNKRESVFASKLIKVNKAISIAGETRLVIKSYQKPTLIRSSSQKNILLEGVQDYSIQGYHTDECNAEKSKASVESAKATVGYEVKRGNGNVYVNTTGEWRFIHHQSAFSSIKITLPEKMNFQYIHAPLKRGR